VVEFPGQDLQIAVGILDHARCFWQNAPPGGDAAAARWLGQTERLVSSSDRGDLYGHMGHAQDALAKGGLLTSAETVAEFRMALSAYQRRDTSVITASNIIARIDEIERTIRREMRTVVFLYLPTYSVKR